MKKILIIHSNMEIGGAETSLLGLLNSLNYTKVSVSLFLLEQKGELLSLVPKEVYVMDAIPAYEALVSPIKQSIKSLKIRIAAARLHAKYICARNNKKMAYRDYGYIVKQRSHYMAIPYLPNIPGEYDLAISFNDPHYILTEKVNARVKIGWFHTDFSRIDTDEKLESDMWSRCDYIVTVSENCKNTFDEKHSALSRKCIVIENILSKEYIKKQAKQDLAKEEMSEDRTVKILSIGRFSNAKNFDNVPDICRRIREDGVDVHWYLVGYGGDEPLIRQKIAESGMGEYVHILGKKDNPYPYISACDIYVQPSRYEGKCVAVREAQILEKPVIITNYVTASSQLTDGYDGVIVPMDNEGCAEGIVRVLRDKELQRKIVENSKKCDYTNAAEIEKLYKLMES